MGRRKHHKGRHSVIVGTKPVRGGHTPSVARHQAGKPELRHRRGEIVTDTTLMVQEVRCHERADRMAAVVFWTGRTASIPIEAGHGIGSTRFQVAAEYVLLHIAIMSAGHRCSSGVVPSVG